MSGPISILYICHDGQLYGSQQSLKLILKHIPLHGFKPFVSLARSGPLNEVLQALPQLTLLTHQRIQWVKHDPRSGLQRVRDLLSLLWGTLPRTLRLYGHIRKHHIRLVHTNSLVSLEGALAARMAGVPHVWHIRELFMEENPKLQMVLGRRLTRWLVHHLSHQVFCISQAVQHQFQPYLFQQADKYPILYNAIDELPPGEDVIPQTREAGAFRIGYIGRLSTGKRFQDLLEAFALLKEKTDQPVELVVAGSFVDDGFEKQIRERLQGLNLESAVTFLGYQENLASLYLRLDVLVVPSLNEPFGRVVIEAMAHGLPCIGARSGGIPEIMTHGETGLLYPPKDVGALAETLLQVTKHPESLCGLRENARRMVQERFTIELQISTLVHCYQRVLERNL